jgi:DNA-binding transcriptional ArsR family regulator
MSLDDVAEDGPAAAGGESSGREPVDQESANPEQVQPSPLAQLRLRRVTDARAMRAVSHPVRIAIIEELTMGGAMTATEVGERIGESPTTCSFHLRQLAKYGWVEEAGGGKGRARPWRMTSFGFETPSTHDDPDTDVAASTLHRLLRERQLARYETWIETRAAYPRRWRQAVSDSEYLLYLTPEELEQLNRDVQAAIVPWVREDRVSDPAKRPPDSLPIELMTLGYPIERPNAATGGTPTEEGAG